MGIKGLAKLIAERAPACMRENEMKNYFGRKVAIDASMSIYQFLVAVRSGGENLTNADGETTSHLMGIFYRTIRMVTNGVKPLYVFDGKPPDMKGGELAKRKEAREKAEKSLQDAKETGNSEEVEKFNRRLVRCTPQHNKECQELLTLMGIPYVEAPCEAEAQCCELAKAGKVWATATEDMDALTFGTPVLLRHMTFSEARKMPIKEYHVDEFLTETGLSKNQFVDLCILLGCDYCDTIKGIGPKKAYELIEKYKDIETILKFLDKKKYPVPEDWPFARARQLFLEPEVTKADELTLKWSAPDIEGLVDYMCNKNGFGEDRIRSGAAKLKKAKEVKPQGRLDSFFKKLPSSGSSKKRKAPIANNANKKTKSKGTSFFKSRK